jgi:predicted ribonuclease YlaK
MKKLRLENLEVVEPITKKQEETFKEYDAGNSLVLSGSAGTGKTFLAMYMALVEVLDKASSFDKVVVIRSIVPTRDIGFLPGDEDEKKLVYEQPYQSICRELIKGCDRDPWEQLKATGMAEFISTSFIRGFTLKNCIVIVDEMQNLTGRELNTVITRLGENTRLVMCGDYHQSDFAHKNDKNDILSFLKILDGMQKVSKVEFGWEDIVRSGLVRDYIMTKEMMKLEVDW